MFFDINYQPGLENMKKLLLFALLMSCFTAKTFSQCAGTTLTVNNPSFEGPVGAGITPPNWDICQPGVTPDTQPGEWGITLAPANGSSYVAFCNQTSGNWHEGASQTLSSPMVAGTTYSFTLDLATTNSTVGGITPGCIELQIWGNMGGNTGCDESALLWSSGDVYDAAHMNQWVLTNVTFTPTQNWSHLLFMSNNLGCVDNPYIMMDNLSPITPIVDVPAFTWLNPCQGGALQFTDQSVSTDGTINSWSWDFGDGNSSVSQNPSHLYTTPQTYNVTLTVTSTVPCTTSVTHPVNVNPLPAFHITPANPSICMGSSVICNAAPTGSGSYNYQWSPSNGLSTTNGPTVTANPQSTTIYTVTATDPNGCSNTSSFTITVNPMPAPTITSHNDSCGLGHGFAQVFPNGGTPTFTFNWSTSPPQTNALATNLPAGTYTVTVSDFNTCSATSSVTITAPPPFLTTISSVDSVLCFSQTNGNMNVHTTGGTPGYTYIWNTSPPQTDSTALNLAAGTYTVTVTDIMGCVSTISSTVYQPTQLAVTVSGLTPVPCYGQSNGSATISASGGVPGYIYQWSTSPSQTTATASNLPAGTYTVTVSDHNSCTTTTSATITQPTLLISTVSSIDSVQCNGLGNGSINVNTSGGTTNYTYLWNTTPSQTTSTANNLHAGSYTVTVTDANGCTNTLNATVYEPTVLAAAINHVDSVNCFGQNNGSITTTVTGGTPTYIYHWNTTPPQNGSSLSNVPAGPYSVTVTDHNGCTSTLTTIVYQPNALVLNLTPHNEGCLNSCNGQVSAAASGGTGNINYIWSNNHTTPAITGLCPGVYSVTITDHNNCTVSGSSTISTNTLINANFIATPTIGTIPFDVNFTFTGSGANTYSWNFGDGGTSTLQDPTHTYTTTGNYHVILLVNSGSPDNCTDTVSLLVIADNPSFLTVPNVFTPNGDGINDEFLVKYQSIESFSCVIYTRWGTKIYEWSDVSKGWDGKTSGGKMSSDGTYYYILSAMGVDKTDYELHGTVTLISH